MASNETGSRPDKLPASDPIKMFDSSTQMTMRYWTNPVSDEHWYKMNTGQNSSIIIIPCEVGWMNVVELA